MFLKKSIFKTFVKNFYFVFGDFFYTIYCMRKIFSFSKTSLKKTDVRKGTSLPTSFALLWVSDVRKINFSHNRLPFYWESVATFWIF